jgi:predicted nucleic acid-binding protein
VPAIYLDACCLNRPFDDQTIDRIRLEAEAVLLILRRVESGEWWWVSSETLDFEINQNPDPERRARVALMMSHAHRFILAEQKEAERAQKLETMGFRSFDALHLACAESGGADVFLTTDDRLLSQAVRASEELKVRVENPLVWLKEATEK